MKNPFSKDAEIPVAINVGDEDTEDKADVQRQFYAPEGYYEYQAQKINPEAAEIFSEIFRDWQLGYYTKEDFQNLLFLFTHAIGCLKYKFTHKYGNRVLEMANFYSISTNSKEGFLRKQEATKTKEALIKQAKNWKERIKW